jgi:hypothetical protein
MRRLPLSASESLFLSAQIALDANDIPYNTSGSPLSWGAGPGSLGTILVDDADYDRAIAVIRDLQDTTVESAHDAYQSPIFRAFVQAIASGILWLWLELILRRPR